MKINVFIYDKNIDNILKYKCDLKTWHQIYIFLKIIIKHISTMVNKYIFKYSHYTLKTHR